jgi:hypothetical protein
MRTTQENFEPEGPEKLFTSNILNTRYEKLKDVEVKIDDEKKDAFNTAFAEFYKPFYVYGVSSVVNDAPGFFRFNDGSYSYDYKYNVITYHKLLQFLSDSNITDSKIKNLAMQLTFTFGNFEIAMRYLRDYEQVHKIPINNINPINNRNFAKEILTACNYIQLENGATPYLWWSILQNNLLQLQDPLSNVQDPVVLLLPYAKQIEKMVATEQPGTDMSQLSLPVLIKYGARCKFKIIDKNCPPGHEDRERVLNSAAIAFKLQYDAGSHFDGLDLTSKYGTALKPTVENLEIPYVTVDGTGTNKKFYIRRLDPADPRAPFLPRLVMGIPHTHHIHLNKEINAGVTDPDSAFYILCEKKGDSIDTEKDPILAYTLASRGTKNEILLGLLHHHPSLENDESYPQVAHDLFIQLGNELVKDPKVTSVLVEEGSKIGHECFRIGDVYSHPDNNRSGSERYMVLAVKGHNLYGDPSSTENTSTKTNYDKYPDDYPKIPYPKLMREDEARKVEVNKKREIEREKIFKEREAKEREKAEREARERVTKEKEEREAREAREKAEGEQRKRIENEKRQRAENERNALTKNIPDVPPINSKTKPGVSITVTTNDNVNSLGTKILNDISNTTTETNHPTVLNSLHSSPPALNTYSPNDPDAKLSYLSGYDIEEDKKNKMSGNDLPDKITPLLIGEDFEKRFIPSQPKLKRNFFDKLFSAPATTSSIDTEKILAEVYQAKKLNDEFLANARKIRIMKGIDIDFAKEAEAARIDDIPFFCINSSGICKSYIKSMGGFWQECVLEENEANEIFKMLNATVANTEVFDKVFTPVVENNNDKLITQLNAIHFYNQKTIYDSDNQSFDDIGEYYKFLKNSYSELKKKYGSTKARIIASTYNKIFPVDRDENGKPVQNSPFPTFTVDGKEVARNRTEARSINDAVKLHSELVDDVLNKYETVENPETHKWEVKSNKNGKSENKTLFALIERFNDYIQNRNQLSANMPQTKSKSSKKQLTLKNKIIQDEKNQPIKVYLDVSDVHSIYQKICDNKKINPKYSNGWVLIIDKDIDTEKNINKHEVLCFYNGNLVLNHDPIRIKHLKQLLHDHHHESKHAVLSYDDFDSFMRATTFDDVDPEIIRRFASSNKTTTWQNDNYQIDALLVAKETLELIDSMTIKPQSTLFGSSNHVSPAKKMSDIITKLEQYPAERSSIESTLKLIAVNALDQYAKPKNSAKQNTLFKNIANLMDIPLILEKMEGAISKTTFDVGYVWNEENNKIPVNNGLVPSGVKKIYDIISKDTTDETKLRLIRKIIKEKLNETTLTRSKSTTDFYKNMSKLVVLKNGIELNEAIENIKNENDKLKQGKKTLLPRSSSRSDVKSQDIMYESSDEDGNKITPPSNNRD